MGKKDRDMQDESAAPQAPAEQAPPAAEPAPAPKVEPQAAAEVTAELFPVSKLAERHGQLHKATVADDEPYKTAHLVASTRHGWRLHHHHTGAEVKLTDADYLAALEAARNGKCHAPANRRDPEVEARKQASREEAKKKAQPQAKKGA